MLEKLVFFNKDAFQKKITISCDKASVPHVVQWYDGFYAGDDYKLYINEKLAVLNNCGEIKNLNEILGEPA